MNIISSKNKETLKIIHEELLKVSKSEEIHSLCDSFKNMNKKIIHLHEFSNLLDVSLSFSKEFDTRDLHNPFHWIKKIDSPSKKSYKDFFKIVFNYFDEKGVMKVILILITVTIFGLIMNWLGLLDWAIKIIPSLIG